MYQIIVGLLCCCIFTSQAQDIDVIAFEYPPYLTQYSADQGEAVVLLQRAFAYSALNTNVKFVNSTTAQKQLNSNNWCLSFLPPKTPSALHLQVILADKTIPLMLFRLAEPHVFIGNELKDKVIAHLPISLEDRKIRSFVDAEAKLQLVETIEQGLSLLLEQKVDYVYGDQQGINFAANKLNFPAMLLQDSAMVFYQFPMAVWLNAQCKNAEAIKSHLTEKKYQIKSF
jgi:polar amino acid transport system substrate-binding protein